MSLKSILYVLLKEVLERLTGIYSSSMQYINAANRQIKNSKANVGEVLRKLLCKCSWKCNLLGTGVSKYRLVKYHPDVEIQDGTCLLD